MRDNTNHNNRLIVLALADAIAESAAQPFQIVDYVQTANKTACNKN
jgi:hypothetical protein